MKNEGCLTPNIWVITPKKEGCGFPMVGRYTNRSIDPSWDSEASNLRSLPWRG